MKYINTKRHGIVVFPESMIHREVAQQLGICLEVGLISAGFVRLFLTGDELHVECYGESESLRLASRFQKDSEQLEKQLVEGKYSDPTFQERVKVWTRTCFGRAIADDLQERNRRFLEEALELVQSCDFSREAAHAMVDYVYDRPVGETFQEVGGVEVTLSALCNANDIDQVVARETELTRIKGLIDVIREKQSKKPTFDKELAGGKG